MVAPVGAPNRDDCAQNPADRIGGVASGAFTLSGSPGLLSQPSGLSEEPTLVYLTESVLYTTPFNPRSAFLFFPNSFINESLFLFHQKTVHGQS